MKERQRAPVRLVLLHPSSLILHPSCLLACLVLGQGDADELLVVAGEDAALGEGGMGPDHVPAARRLYRVEDMGAIDLLVAVRRQFGEDQVSLVVEQDVAVVLLDDEGGAAVGLLAAGGGVGLPALFPGAGVE